MEQVTLQQALERALQSYNSRDLIQAESICRQILSQHRDNAHALHLLGIIANDTGHTASAYELLTRAAQFEHGVPDLFNNLSVVCRNLGRVDEATQFAARAVAMAPNVAVYLNNLGIAQVFNGNVREALASFERAVACDPNFADAHDSLGLTLLLLGELQRGWREQEWRFRKSDASPPLQFERPQWTGQDLSGKTILLHAEQGYGDTIQFVRYAPLLSDRGARVTIVAPPDVAALLATVDPRARVVTSLDDVGPHDFHCPLLSLPLGFGTTLETIPNQAPYLRADAKKTGRWRERFDRDALNVGLVWAGRPSHKRDRERSIPAADLSPLTRVPGVRSFSLQMG
ncbi:MAG: tetratricopeptide repeat protein, partial [Tepidisphaeraceae bacterium]